MPVEFISDENVIKEGSILLRTGYTIYEKSKRPIFAGYVLN